MRKFNYLIASLLIVTTAISCDALVGDPELPIPLDETLANTGAFLRVLSVESSGFDVADLATASYSFTGELQDVNNGADVDRVEFYVSYVSADRATTIAEPASPITSVNSGSFTTREASGLPSTSFTIALNDILSYLSLPLANLNLGDNFEIRWVLVMKDGKEYTNTDASPAVTGGFYLSPYFARASVVQGISTTIFVGDYQLTQNGPGSVLFGQSTVFGPDPITLEVDPSNTLNGRIARDVCYLPAFGCFNSDIPFTFFRKQDFNAFTAADNWVSFPGNVDPSVGCGIGLIFGAVQDEAKSNFDVNDDSTFDFTINDNRNADCGGNPTEVNFGAVKQ